MARARVVNLYSYTLEEPNTYKPYGFVLGFLAKLRLCVYVLLSFVFCGEINKFSSVLGWYMQV